MSALIEASPPGSIQAASDSFLRQAVTAICTVEDTPTLNHVYSLLDTENDDYRNRVVHALKKRPDSQFLYDYWDKEFPSLISNNRFAVERLNPPRNKLQRILSVSSIDTLLRHPRQIDLDSIIENKEVLIIDGAKEAVGEDNAVFIGQIILHLLYRSIMAQLSKPEKERGSVALHLDEAHNFLTETVADLLAEGRKAGLQACFAYQYSQQIQDEKIRSGVRSLLQSILLFRLRELDDARSYAGLAQRVYTDSIRSDEEDQERMRFSVEDITHLPKWHAICMWVAGESPQPAFIAKTIDPSELESAKSRQRVKFHTANQRKRGGRFYSYLEQHDTSLAYAPPVDATRTSAPHSKEDSDENFIPT